MTELHAISMNVMGIDLRPSTALAFRAHRRRWRRLFLALARSGADIIGVQELFWPGQRALFASCLEPAGYRLACGPTSWRRPGGLALAIRGRTLEHRHHTFCSRKNLRSRWVRYGVLRARAELGDRTVDVAVTHLEAGRSGEGRAQQALELSSWLRGGSPEHSPAVLLGDMNAPPGSEVASCLEKEWQDCCGPDFGPTWGWNALAGRGAVPERLDSVYLRKGAGLVRQGARSVFDDPADPLSDHSGIEVVFRLSSQEPAV